MSGGIAGRGYVPALDGLRALAVIGVIAFHDDRLPGGFLGVDLFFAVSGFLITSLLLDEHARTGRIDLVGFWGRRLRRLMPAVIALLAVTVVVVWCGTRRAVARALRCCVTQLRRCALRSWLTQRW